MNNLKRILSLALASVMLVGMMVVGASAAEFVDGDDITHDAAVDTMTALNIIGGYAEDNTFRPNVKVTRAQMAKMIAVALNGGKDPVAGLTTGSKFVDVADNHWAIDYITYCANLGIISGKDATHYDPEGFVKANEAAKMLLVAIGYDADTFGFTGANWSTNVIRMATTLLIGGKLDDKGELTGASSLNLFDGLEGVVVDAELTRDQAAQLIYNGIQANGVKMSLTGVTDGKPSYTYSLTGDSILVSKFKAKVSEGVLKSVVKYTAATSKTPASWTYSVDVITGTNTTKATNFTTSMDVSDLFMQKVRVVARDNDREVLSITPANVNDVVSSGVVADLVEGGKDGSAYYTLDGLKMNGDAAISALDVYTFLGSSAKYGAGLKNPAYHEYRLIDNNGDGAVDCMVVFPVTVEKVNAVNTDSVRLSATGKVALKGNDVVGGLVKDDYVTVSQHPLTKVITVKNTNTLTGTVDAVRDGEIRVDGTWYDTVDNDAYTTLAKLLGTESKLVLVGELLFTGEAVKEAEKASDAVMAVKAAADATKIAGDIDTKATAYLQVRILKADKSVEVLKVVNIRANAADETGTDVTDSTQGTAVNLGTLYTYSLDKQGYATLVPYAPAEGTLTLTNPTTTDGVAKGTAGANAPNSFRFNDDATIFVYVAPTGSGVTAVAEKYDVLTGADVNAWGKTSYAATGTLYGAKAANGFTYAALGALTMTSIPGAGADTATYYGIVTADSSRIYEAADKLYYLETALWNGEENTTIKANGNATAGNVDPTAYKKGTVVTYTVNADGSITMGKIVANDTTITTEAVEAYDNVSTIKFVNRTNDTNNEFDVSKAFVSYVDTKKNAGELGTTIPLAELVDEEDPNKGYKANVWVIWADDTQKAIKAIIVEVNGDTKGAAKGEHVGESKGQIDTLATPITLSSETTYDLTPAQGKAAVTGAYNDWILDSDGTTKLYTFGIFENDIKDTTSTEWNLFTVEVGEGTWKMERFNNGETTAVRTSNATVEAGNNETFAMICGNSQDVTYKLTKAAVPESSEGAGDGSPAVTYTFTWTK